MELATKCAICDCFGNSSIVFERNFEPEDLNPEIFSARRIPDRRHYQWVKCNQCHLYRSDPVEDIDLSELYRISNFDYSQELHGLRNSYRKIVERVCPVPFGKHLVEVGGGNGFFLEEALTMGFEKVTEIEPSEDARIHAPQEIQKFFITDILREGVIPNNSTDVVVIFHTLDHLQEPKKALELIRNFLRPGGSICIAVHNVESISAKLFKSRSPIFDIEHTFLYSKSTLRKLLEISGYSDIQVHHYKNSYSLAYLIHLIPIGRSFKLKILNSNIGKILRRFRVTVPLGNMWAEAKKI
jgi:SAM-dependent methyltransferase